MAEDATQDPDSDPVGRPAAVPKPPLYSVVVEGDATEIGEPAPEPPPEEPLAAEAVEDQPTPEPKVFEPPPPPPPPARRSGFPFLASLLGALVGAAAALAAAWFYDPRADQLRDIAARQSALESAASEQSAATKALAAGAAKASAVQALDKRLGALETAAIKPDALLAAQADASAAREAATKALALAGQPGAPGEAPAAAPDPRIGKLENDLSALSARVADLTGLGDRVAKLDSALAAPKSETRVSAAEISQEVDPASQAIAAIALEQRLRAGEPFASEWAALTRLRADPPSLAALKPYSETGAPTAAALAASFAKVAPAMFAAVTPESTGGPMDKLIDHMRKLVRVHAVGEVPGEEPDALVSQVEAALARGQVAVAMGIYARLPEAARKASADWAKTAEARASADAAARQLRESAIAHLAAAKN
jgi:hypothetical protein